MIMIRQIMKIIILNVRLIIIIKAEGVEKDHGGIFVVIQKATGERDKKEQNYGRKKSSW